MSRPAPIAFVAPVLPFRGGIAQHATLLSRELGKRVELKLFSFSRLYPKLIFPGETDRDADYAGHQEDHAEYILDSINPLTWFRTARRVRASGAKQVVIAAWTFFLAPCLAVVAWRCARAGIEVVLFVHNADDHEQSWWKRWLNHLLLARADRFVAHTRADRAMLRAAFENKPVVIHPHPIYSQFPKQANAAPRRARLELLFFGFVRHYKGLDILIDALALLPDLDLKLTVAGEFWDGQGAIKARMEKLGVADRVELIPHYISNSETSALFKRADLVVLPYRSATGSGVIPLAYNYAKPVVATNVGGLPDVVLEGMTGCLAQPDDPEQLAAAIRRATSLDPARTERYINGLVSQLTWASLAKSVVTLVSFEPETPETAR